MVIPPPLALALPYPSLCPSFALPLAPALPVPFLCLTPPLCPSSALPLPYPSPLPFLCPYHTYLICLTRPPCPSSALTISPLPSATLIFLLNDHPLPLLPLSLPLQLPHACPFLSSPTNASCLVCFQHCHSSLVDCRSVIDEIGDGAEEVDLGGRSIAMRAYASWFNFKGADQQKSVGVLSGGERNRLQLAKVCCELFAAHLCLQSLQLLVKHDIVNEQPNTGPCSLAMACVL